jgi:hypothetical protein
LRPAIRLSDRHPSDHVSVAGERRCLGSGSYRHSATERKNCRAREGSHESLIDFGKGGWSCLLPSLWQPVRVDDAAEIGELIGDDFRVLLGFSGFQVVIGHLFSCLLGLVFAALLAAMILSERARAVALCRVTAALIFALISGDRRLPLWNVMGSSLFSGHKENNSSHHGRKLRVTRMIPPANWDDIPCGIHQIAPSTILLASGFAGGLIWTPRAAVMLSRGRKTTH